MAKNWKVGEAINAVRNGDKEAILDIGRRFPLFVSNCLTEAGLIKLLEALPDYITVRKIEAVLKNDNDTSDDEKEVKSKKVKVENDAEEADVEDEVDDEEEEEVEKPAKKAKKEKKDKKKVVKKQVIEDDDDDDDWDI